MDRDDRRRGTYIPSFVIQRPNRPPTPQEAEWASDANAFVAQESEESTSYSVRVASCDLLDMLVDRLSARVLPAVQANLGLVIAQSGDASAARADDWWRPLEAAFAAFGAIAQTVLEILEDEKSAGKALSLDLSQLLVNVIPGILTQSRMFHASCCFMRF